MFDIHRYARAVFVLGLLLYARAAMAADRSWINPAGGVFSTAANWSPATVPVAGDTAIFNLGDPGYTVTFTSGTLGPVNSSLRIENDTVTFDLGGGRSAYDITGSTFVGQIGPDVGRLTLLNGLLNSGELQVGSGSDSKGFLTVSSGATAGIVGALRIGQSGSGTLSIINGGRAGSATGIIGQSAGGEGNIIISGAGSFGFTRDQLLIGDLGSGSLTVSAAGLLNNSSASVGNQAGGRGTVNITGFSASWQVNNLLEVGNSGTGSVTVQSGASLSTSNGTIGVALSGMGAVTVTGANSIWSNADQIQVGRFGSGALTISDRATLNSNSAFVGFNAGGFGTMSVTGQGTEMRLAGQLLVGNGGIGEMATTQGGQVRSASALIGNGVDGRGTLLVSDPGSRVAVAGNFTVGGSGRGTASITSGGAISSGLTRIGLDQGSVGTALVSGPGSTWQVAGVVSVAQEGQGSLTVSDGASVSATSDLNIAGLAGSSGSLTITGAGSRVDMSRLFVGGTGSTAGGAGLLAIGPGASATAPDSAKVYFGSRLTIDQGTLSTGALDNRGLIVNTDGLISATNLPNFGTLRLAGTSARVNSPVGNSGLITGSGEIAGSLFNTNTAEIRVAASDHLLFAANSNTNQGRINLLGGTLEFANQLGNSDIGTITGRGTLIAANNISNGGTLTLSAGLSDVIATLNNSAASSTVIITGGATATFHRNVSNIAGSAFRIHDSATAVFLGNVSGLAAFTGGGTKIFEGGTSGGGALATTGSTEVLAPASLSASHIRERSLIVKGDVRLVPGGGTSKVNELSIDPGGTLDLADNAFIVDYTGPSPIADVRQDLLTAFAGGTWVGDGLTSSTAAGDPRLGIGYGEADDILGPAGGTFAGQPADATAVLIRTTLKGDANLDGTVSFADLVALAQNYNRFGPAVVWSRGDFDYDASVGFADLVALAQNYNTSLPAALPGVGDAFNADLAAAAVAVPEPTFITCIMVVVPLVMRRNRRG